MNWESLENFSMDAQAQSYCANEALYCPDLDVGLFEFRFCFFSFLKLQYVGCSMPENIFDNLMISCMMTNVFLFHYYNSNLSLVKLELYLFLW